MSVTELSAPPAIAPAAERSLSGWGRSSWSRCAVRRPRGAAEVVEALASSARSGRHTIARGAGRSYGDAAQSQGGDVLDMTALNRVLSIDPQRMLVTAEAGATVGQLMARLSAHGLTLPVVPGTRHVTLGGAIASDIHGKNHHCDGAFARHVTALTLCTPGGEILELTPESDADLFYGTLGGMGLTGVVIEATVRAEPLSRPWGAGDLDRTNGLVETLELLSGHERHRYSVAWLDLLAPGAKMGRAIVSRADPRGSRDPPRAARGSVPQARWRQATPHGLHGDDGASRGPTPGRCRDRRWPMFRAHFQGRCCGPRACARSTRCAGGRRPGASAGAHWRSPRTSFRWTSSVSGTASTERPGWCSTSS